MEKRDAVRDGRQLMEQDDLGLSLYETLRRYMPATQSRARVVLKGIVDVDTPEHPNYRSGDVDGVPV
jgi:hypothetical protein